MSLSKDLMKTSIMSDKKQKKESVTPHKIAIAILIRQFCLFRECSKQISGSYYFECYISWDFNFLLYFSYILLAPSDALTNT